MRSLEVPQKLASLSSAYIYIQAPRRRKMMREAYKSVKINVFSKVVEDGELWSDACPAT